MVYGPLCVGATTVLFNANPFSPTPGRIWEMVDRVQATSIYMAPTLIRSLMKFGDAHVKQYKRTSLRILASIGEPLNPAAWMWYFSVVGDGKAGVVDTFFQTETGGIMLSTRASLIKGRPGAVGFPFPGVEAKLLDPKSGQVIEGEGKGVLVFGTPWPSLGKTIYNDHERYLNTYLRPYPGYYFTGDGAYRDKDGYFWITGRVDDVIEFLGEFRKLTLKSLRKPLGLDCQGGSCTWSRYWSQEVSDNGFADYGCDGRDVFGKKEFKCEGEKYKVKPELYRTFAADRFQDAVIASAQMLLYYYAYEGASSKEQQTQWLPNKKLLEWVQKNY